MLLPADLHPYSSHQPTFFCRLQRVRDPLNNLPCAHDSTAALSAKHSTPRPLSCCPGVGQLTTMDRRPLPHELLLLLLAVSRPATATFTNDFSGYPAGAQDCLYDAADQSNCQGDSSQEMNSCLCSNGGDFVTDAGTCIAQADSGDMRSTWVRV